MKPRIDQIAGVLLLIALAVAMAMILRSMVQNARETGRSTEKLTNAAYAELRMRFPER